MHAGLGVGVAASAVSGPLNYVFTPLAAAYVIGLRSATEVTAKTTPNTTTGSATSLVVDGEHTYTDLEGHFYRYYLAFVSFTTSSLAGKTISAASIEVEVNSVGVGGIPSCQVRAYNFGASVDNSDFHLPGEPVIATGNLSSAGLGRVFVGVGSNLINAINKTGVTYFMFSEPSHASGSLADNVINTAGFRNPQLKVTAA